MSENCNHEFVDEWEETYQYIEELNGYKDKIEIYRADAICIKCKIEQSRFGKSYIEKGE